MMSIIKNDFVLALDQDVVISETNATMGQHQTLDYIPGATLLGLVASRLYVSLDAMSAWEVFHSGRIRFSDALPCASDGQTAWPMPLALHSYKGERIAQDTNTTLATTLNGDRLFNPAVSQDLDSSRQPVQLRNGYLTDAGDYLETPLTQRMKTAIDPDTGLVAQSQLFGYQSIQAGQRFHFSLIVDDDIEPKLLEQVCQALAGPARLGRSRSAQYGGVSIAPATAGFPPLRHQQSQGNTVLVWLLSDMALVSVSGEPRLQPSADDFRLPPGSSWCVAGSFLRARSYSPYNAKRRCYDPQRQVISRGSVLSFTVPASADVSGIDGSVWTGLYQEAGLGHVVVMPTLLSSAHPQFDTRQHTTAQESEVLPLRPNTPLIALLERSRAEQGASQQAQVQAEGIYARLLQGLATARRWQAVQDYEPLVAPSRAQWGQLKALSNDYRSSPEGLWNALFIGEQALLKERQGQPGWSLQLGPNQTLRVLFEDLLRPHQQQHWFPDLVARLAVLSLGSDWKQQVEGQLTEQEVSS